MEWAAPGVVVGAAPFGEGDALGSVFTEEYGIFRGLARGGLSRKQANIWQVGNLIEARWMARLADSLGSLTAELVHPAAALAMNDALAQAMLAAACALAEGALPEREPHPRVFRGLLHVIAHVEAGLPGLASLAEWEVGLLGELGYGLDFTCCAVTGTRENLAYVSPKTGRAVSVEGAGAWRDRLLKLPAFLHTQTNPDMKDIKDALRLTGHFLTRDVFGLRHRPLPAARTMLFDRVCGVGDASPN